MNIKKFTLATFTKAALLTLISIHVSAQQLPQQWLRSFRAQGLCSDRVSKIKADNSGNVYIAGYASADRGQPDYFVMKRDAQGDTLWFYYYDSGFRGEDYVRDLAVDNSGNVFITGESDRTFAGNRDAVTIKLNSSGVQQWIARYPSPTAGETFANSIAVDATGNVYIAGQHRPSSGSYDWFVVKYNSSGTQQWADIYNGPGSAEDEALAISIAPNGNATACGYIHSGNANGGTNLYVKQYSSTGTTVWSDTYTNPVFNGPDRAKGLGFSAAGDLYVGGETNNSAGFSTDAVALKYNSAGARQWDFIYVDPLTTDEYVLDVKVDNNGNTFIAGTDYTNGFVSRINANGTAGWMKRWRGPLPFGYDVIYAMEIDNNGGVYTTGRGVYPGVDHYGNGGMANQFIAKFNDNGDSLWTYRSADTLTPSMGFAITALNGKVYAGGFKNDSAYHNENLYVMIADTTGPALAEWVYNGKGDAITRGQFVRIDAQNNVYCAATTDRLGFQTGLDVSIVKYDAAGTQLWERYYTSPGWNNDTLTGMELNPSGQLVLSISSDSAQLKNNYRQSLVTMDSNGNFIDTAWYLPSPLGSTLANAMLMRNDGSVVIGATSNLIGGVMIFFDASGAVQWSAKLDSTQFAATKINSLAAFPNNDIAVAGMVQTGGGNTGKGVVQRFTALGARLWTADFDSANVYDEAKDVTVSPSGEVSVTGLSGYTTTGTSALMTFNGTTGAILWRKSYNPNTTNEYGVKVRYTPAGNLVYICRGWTGFVARYTTVQFSGTGIFQWATVYSQQASDREPVDMLVEANNRVVTAGWLIDATSTNFNYVLVGYNSNGVQQFENIWANTTTTQSNPDVLKCLSRDGLGNFIVTGESADDFLNNFLYRMVTIKYGGSATGIDENPAEYTGNVIAYPNPSADGIFQLIDAAADAPINSAQVMDLQGRLLRTIPVSNDVVNINVLPSGVYLLRYFRDDRPAGTLKLIR
jgi:hypothetical protein